MLRGMYNETFDANAVLTGVLEGTSKPYLNPSLQVRFGQNDARVFPSKLQGHRGEMNCGCLEDFSANCFATDERDVSGNVGLVKRWWRVEDTDFMFGDMVSASASEG